MSRKRIRRISAQLFDIINAHIARNTNVTTPPRKRQDFASAQLKKFAKIKVYPAY